MNAKKRKKTHQSAGTGKRPKSNSGHGFRRSGKTRVLHKTKYSCASRSAGSRTRKKKTSAGMHQFSPDGRLLYMIAFMLFITQTFMERLLTDDIFGYSSSLVRTYIRYAVLVFLLLKLVCCRDMKRRQYAAAAALVLLGYITWRNSDMNVFFYLTAFVACGRDIRIKDLAKAALCVYLPGTILTVSAAMLGVIENGILTRNDGTLRYAMGFKHPNSFGLMLFMIGISYCAIRYGKKPRSEFAVIAVCAALCWIVPNSRTFTLLLVLLAGAVWIFYYVRAQWLSMTLRVLMAVCALSLIALSLFLMVSYTGEDPLIEEWNVLLSNRISLANLYFTECGVTLLGQKIGGSITFNNGIRTVSFMVDNAYCHLIIRYGIAAMAVFAAFCVFFYADQLKKRRWGFGLIGITLFLVLGCTENMSIKFEYNYFMIAFAHLLYRDHEKQPRKIPFRDRNLHKSCTERKPD